VREEAFTGVEEGYPRLVARGFDTEDNHEMPEEGLKRGGNHL
jgi:hypothetical protein